MNCRITFCQGKVFSCIIYATKQKATIGSCVKHLLEDLTYILLTEYWKLCRNFREDESEKDISVRSERDMQIQTYFSPIPHIPPDF